MESWHSTSQARGRLIYICRPDAALGSPQHDRRGTPCRFSEDPSIAGSEISSNALIGIECPDLASQGPGSLKITILDYPSTFAEARREKPALQMMIRIQEPVAVVFPARGRLLNGVIVRRNHAGEVGPRLGLCT